MPILPELEPPKQNWAGSWNIQIKVSSLNILQAECTLDYLALDNRLMNHLEVVLRLGRPAALLTRRVLAVLRRRRRRRSAAHGRQRRGGRRGRRRRRVRVVDERGVSGRRLRLVPGR